MAGNKIGGMKARDTNVNRHGPDFYTRIGRLSHKSWIDNGRKPRGFSIWKLNGQEDKIREAGRKGSKVSRRIKKEV